MTNCGDGGWSRRTADEANDAILASLAAADQARVVLLQQLVEAAERATFLADGATSLTAWLKRRGEMTDQEAARTSRRVHVLRRLPRFADLLFSGAVTVGHLDALAEVANERRQAAFDEYGQPLVDAASTCSASEFARGCRHFAALADEHVAEPAHPTAAGKLSFTSSLFGEAELSGRLTADQASAVGAAFDQLCAPDPVDAPVRRSLRQRRADALAELATGHTGAQSSPAGRRPANAATIVIDLDRLVDVDDEVDLATIRRDLLFGGPIPARVAELLTCDATIRRLVTDPTGAPLNLGRRTAAVSNAQRHALAIRDGGCMFPVCDRPASWCDAHHIEHWAHGGATDIDNLVLLCRHHHRLVHGPEWSLSRDPATGRVTATRNDGRV